MFLFFPLHIEKVDDIGVFDCKNVLYLHSRMSSLHVKVMFEHAEIVVMNE